MIEKIFYNTLFALFFIAVALWLFVMIGCVFAIKANAQTTYSVGIAWDPPSATDEAAITDSDKYIVTRQIGWSTEQVGEATECRYTDFVPITDELQRVVYWVQNYVKDGPDGKPARSAISNKVFVEVWPVTPTPTPIPEPTKIPDVEPTATPTPVKLYVAPPLNLRVEE